MKPADARSIIRGKGLCGFILGGTHVCVLAIGHDSDVHESSTDVRQLADDLRRALRESLEFANSDTNRAPDEQIDAWQRLVQRAEEMLR